eukprot:ANDGO_07156.mRNA.1 L-gulono-1
MNRATVLASHLTAGTIAHDSSSTAVLPYPPNRVKWRNWAQTAGCVPAYYHQPSSVLELISIVRYAAGRKESVKVVGAGHSPNEIALTTGHMVSLDKVSRILEIHVDRGLVKCEGGCRLRTLNAELLKNGLAISNLGAISEQSISGAIATGTHGTGARFGCIASQIVELELLTADGTILRCSKSENAALFDYARVSLGALGIIITATMQVERAFRLHEVRYSKTFEDVLSSLPQAARSAEHWRVWWFPHTNMCEILECNRTMVSPKRPSSSPLFVAGRLLRDRAFGYHFLEMLLYVSRIFPALVPWINRLYAYTLFRRKRERIDDSFRIFNFDCLFRQYVAEWAIPFERCAEAMKTLRRMIVERGFKAHFPIEVRFVKGDDIPLSMCSGRDTCLIGIIAYRPFMKDVEYRPFFDAFEDMMLSFDGRPHWAKLYRARGEQFRRMYGAANWDGFKTARQQLDPHGIFLNSHLRRVFNIPEASSSWPET